jgi:uncharacterized membrane protein
MSGTMAALLSLNLSVFSAIGVGSLIALIQEDDSDIRRAAALLLAMSVLALTLAIVAFMQWPTLPQAIHAAVHS